MDLLVGRGSISTPDISGSGGGVGGSGGGGEINMRCDPEDNGKLFSRLFRHCICVCVCM